MMEEIGYRTAIYSLEGVTGSQREYMTWLIDTCAIDGVEIDDVLEPAAVDLLAARLRTPLQIEQHLTLALETGFQASEKPITEAIADPCCQSRSTVSRRPSIAMATPRRC
jgi:type II secretory pathway predicted ATPase ExeA